MSKIPHGVTQNGTTYEAVPFTAGFTFVARAENNHYDVAVAF